MKRWIHAKEDVNSKSASSSNISAAVSSWKTRYEVHWISPDGKDCLLGGSKTFEGAQEIAREQADQIFDSPWETNERKFKFLEDMYIYDAENGDEDAMSVETEEYIDNLMSEIHSKISLSRRGK